MKPIDILIPVYDEGPYIKETIDSIINTISYDYNINIIYDKENDSTISIINNHYKKNNIKFIKNNKTGAHNAILTGFNKTSSDAVIVFMADDYYNAKYLNLMIEHFLTGSDIVVASRFLKKSKIKNIKFIKKYITRIGSFVSHYLFGIVVTDSTFAFRLFSRKVLDNYNIQSRNGFSYGTELLVKAQLDKLKITELAADWIDYDHKKSRFRLFSWFPSYGYWIIYYFLKK